MSGTGLLDVTGYVLASLGVVLIALGSIGLVRFPDAYSRLSAVTKAATLGVCLVLLGVAALLPSWPVVVTVVLAIALQLVTSPVGGYALGRAAYRSGSPLAPSSRYDELRDRTEPSTHRSAADEPDPRSVP